MLNHPNLTYHWKLCNNLTDQAATNVTMVRAAGTEAYEASIFGNGCTFNGSTYYRVVATPTASEGTVAFWVKTTSSAGQRTVFATADEVTASNAFEINIRSLSVYIARNVTGTYITSVGTIAGSTWSHVAVTGNGSTYVIYLNGVPQTLGGTGTNNGLWFSTITGIDNITIGARRTSSGVLQYLTGAVQDVQVYNKAFLTADILRIMQGLHPLSRS